ncbi:MAG: hypothetical protein E6293_08260 [Dialister sp.]|nr:hypothetical protein [Dialister sp.]
MRKRRIGTAKFFTLLLLLYHTSADEAVRKRFDLPGHYKMVAQMPFGGIAEEPEPKKKEDISLRVQVIS